jgi:hypothetical protein
VRPRVHRQLGHRAFVSGLLAGVSARDLDLGSVAEALRIEAAPPPRPADIDRIDRRSRGSSSSIGTG